MNLHVVLVRTEHSANVGAVARAMANMGAQRLILLDQRCKIDSAARANAAGAEEKFADVISYKSWDEFFAAEGDGIRIALSRRAGRKRRVTALKEQIKKISTVRQEPIGDSLYEDHGKIQNIYLVFGPESDGLDADDLGLMNFTCHLPVYGEFASLNLAQAVMLSLYIVREQFAPVKMPKQMTGQSAKTVKPFYFPDQLIKEWLEAMGFNVNARKASAYLTLRRLFLQNQPTQHELHVLDAVLRQNIRKLRARSERSVGLTLEELTDDSGDIARQ